MTQNPHSFYQDVSQVNSAKVAPELHHYLYCGRESSSWPQWSRVELLATVVASRALGHNIAGGDFGYSRAVPCDMIMQVALRIQHETSHDVEPVASVTGSMLAMIRGI